MALSDKKIKEEMRKGNIEIYPFKIENLNTSSYDLTLGEYYYRENRRNQDSFYNIYNKKHIEEVWGNPQKAKTAKELLGPNFKKLGFGIEEKDLIILLAPGETILGHTIEFIGGRNTITTQMQARSSIGRSFIEVCKCAGWGDVGYVNRWTMEITNNSCFHQIPLVVGRRIAQMVFLETGTIEQNSYAKSGKYASSENLRDLKKNWQPSDMLPKLYLDKDIKTKKP